MNTRPGERANEKELLAAFKASLDTAKKTGSIIVVTRAANDYETFRWNQDAQAWECCTVGRPSVGGATQVLGFGP